MKRSQSRMRRNIVKLPHTLLFLNLVWVHAFRPTTRRCLYQTTDFYRKVLSPSLQHLRATIDSSSQTEYVSTYRINGINLTNDGDLDELFHQLDQDDVPRPTKNGGYTHTSASKAKISQANKGKTPWNKGQQRSEEVKARIAAGVRAKNRERFLEKLKNLGLTEEEYNEQKKRERAAKDRERRARLTEKGGYRHTPETKQKISSILKEKYASGEIDGKRNVDPSKVRRGFSHSEETRAKISASLRKRWSEDPEYRATMLAKTGAGNSQEHVRQKISETLKRKWQDDEFRSAMLEKMGAANRDTHREKISSAMKAKWQDAEYRKRTLEAISKQRREAAAERGTTLPPRRKRNKPAGPAVPRASAPPSLLTSTSDSLRQLRPRGLGKAETIKVVSPRKPKEKATPALRPAAVRPVAVASKMLMDLDDEDDEDDDDEFEFSITDKPRVKSSSSSHSAPNQQKKKLAKSKNGDKEQLREERRDLYDFLYGDEEGTRSNLASVFALGDENLDEFDPYGLEDF
ncbi:hypothetical protein FisN_16Lh193 [Fistulifera solaris]|uniref:Nuclease associated modular domain-containing protein n=1 Tax=Fistulifera solaris TaxID=1519565 RepID=A0A1Z5KJZ2_FISSO|nr:hypothetical protein FisN_16Lh193 [Fistulifera solaris]|eukprot:GAX26351.1 hypothetical protein FisN_16Lh193 [Fistulifera solaris]